MFDFFNEITDFLSQLVTNANDFKSFLANSLQSFSDVLEWVKEFSNNMPAPYSWVIPLVLMFTVFDFVRGRG